MKINEKNAMRLWKETYGNETYAQDFHGYWMCKYSYGKYNDKYGWNIHHVLPIARGGSNKKENLICTNILTNKVAQDKITYWIDGNLYRVRKHRGTSMHYIQQIK